MGQRHQLVLALFATVHKGNIEDIYLAQAFDPPGTASVNCVKIIFASAMTLTFIQGHNCVSNFTIVSLVM